MEKQIPIYFDTVVLDSPVQQIPLKDSEQCGNRLQVAVFTKYRNRNGSYITEEFADKLIQSAIQGDTPVIGFFDPETQDWASHTGPTLANGYGYVEDFIGWQELTDTDGVNREYAVFSVVLFTKYYEEAKKIIGQNQSMELNPASIEGEWASFDDTEYFVYTSGEMLGLCVIGSHEPCFSVSHFFSKNDDSYPTQHEKISSLLFNLKAQIEEAENNIKGGETAMNEQEKVLENEEEIVEEDKQPEDSFQAETPTEEENAEPAEEVEPAVDFEQQFNDLQKSYEELQTSLEAANARIAELETKYSAAEGDLETLRNEKAQLQATISNYEAQQLKYENDRKIALIEKYEKIISDEEEINKIKESVSDFSYDELESKLAIIFASKQLNTNSTQNKVPLPEPQESQFALLMKKYRKN